MELPLALDVVPRGRTLTVANEASGILHVFRRANGYPWTRVAVNAASPYLDEDAFAPGTLVEYYVEQHSIQGHCLGRSAVVGTRLG